MTATRAVQNKGGSDDDSEVCTCNGYIMIQPRSHMACTSAITEGKAIHSESEDSGFQEADIHVQGSKGQEAL